jgi:hypothetical protein
LNLRPRPANKVDHSLGFGEIQSDWLFAKDCFTGPYRQFNQPGMCISRSYYYDSVNRGMVDGLLNIGRSDLRSRNPFAIFGRLQIWISHNDYLNVGQTAQIAEVRFPHATNPEKANPNGSASFQ